MHFDHVVIIGTSLLYSVSLLVVAALGLALAFGMMRVVNMAHGELLMLGAYVSITLVHAGLGFWLTVPVAALAVGLLGMAVERLILRRLYGRIWATMLATWGLSLLLVGAVQFFFGTTTEGIANPLGTVKVGDYTVSAYNLVMIGAAVVMIVATYLLFHRTPFGATARAAAALPEMASALGVNVARTNMISFGVAAALAGLGGALLAPVSGVGPSFGQGYIGRAFMTVVVGGASPLLGTTSAAALLGGVNAGVSNLAGPVLGTVALLLVSMLVLRFLPTGLTGLWRRSR
ncbi:hypothetical protein [Actinoplanes sp. NPDC051851]|uniref:ABC transporter permease subunit n=1 Tax=Actinoplanes sp. NPDC051851 TaxID=3154753 RepID=UPI003435EFC9